MITNQMKIKRLLRIFGAVGGAVLIAAIWFFYPNDLGLSGFDVLLGGRPDWEMLRTNTKAAADVFLAQHKTQLIGEFGKKFSFALDGSKSPMIWSLGCHSSFYYYCWDVYLPYSLRTDAGDSETVIVQLSDAIPGNHHDPRIFHVIRAMLLDNRGKVIKEIHPS